VRGLLLLTLAHNLFLFNLTRYGDSTALSYYLPGPAQKAVIALCATALLVAIVQNHRLGWSSAGQLAYLLIAHLGLFLSAKIFHNNYLVWLLPLYGLWLSDSLLVFEPINSKIVTVRRATCLGGSQV